MLINYLKSAIRNFLRYKVFATVNIVSLTVGIIGCLAIGLFVWDELQFDKHISGGENIYRIYEERTDNTTKTYNVAAPPAYATFLKQQYPEVEVTTRILMSDDKFLIESEITGITRRRVGLWRHHSWRYSHSNLYMEILQLPLQARTQ
jgi:putative ABC transport system permease protein